MDSIIIVALIGLASGAVASLMAPWINWGITKKKMKFEEKKKLLKDIREKIINEYEESEKFNKDLALKNIDVSKDQIYPKAITYLDTLNKHSCFHQIKTYLSDETISLLENSNLLVLNDRGSKLGQLPKPFQLLMDDLSKIEKKWELL